MKWWWSPWQADPRAEDLGLPMLHHAAELVELGERTMRSARCCWTRYWTPSSLNSMAARGSR